jgi:hypothetical protein
MKTRKAKFLLEAVIVAAITLAFIMPSSAVLTNEKTTELPEGAITQQIIDNKHDALLKDTPQTLAAGDDIWITPLIGDDLHPSITIDGSNNVVIMWTNEESFTTSYQGFSYSNDPSDEQSWVDNGVVLGWSIENPYSFDIGYAQGDIYTGIVGSFFDYTEEAQGGFRMSDVADWEGTLELWTWSGDALEPIMCETNDQVLTAGVHYPQYIGWWDALIYHFEGMGYDIPNCPVFFRTDAAMAGGVSFFDAQENEDTAPANAFDYFVKDGDTIHVGISNEETNKVIHKKIETMEESDIEYTPYQSTIGDGTDVQVAGNVNTIIITAINGGNVIAYISTDDGDSWSSTTIASGNQANICEANGVFYCVYTNNNNLFLTTSEDGGSTWSSGVQVNDEDGTVVADFGFFDIHKGGIVWTDDRGDDWDVYYQPLETGPSPVLEITGIAGGLGVSATINNIGNAPATNVQWTIDAVGTVFVGSTKSGTIGSIAEGGSAGISSFLLGFGGVDISISATCDEGASARADASGNLLLYFLTGI